MRFFFFAFLLIQSASTMAASDAESIFNTSENLVYQVRVVDLGSGDKYSIGSGFRISERGHLATNFHVVSSYVHEPEKFRLEYIASDGSSGALSLLAVDVVHDLAIAHTYIEDTRFLTLSANALAKGERLFSMGNPNDLGMTIVEGTYNGLVEKSRYRKILFSGSLNPGMSGGPAMNAEGEVIGINVSKGGEQISFLVPVDKLASLFAKLEGQSEELNFLQTIKDDLLADQNQFYQTLLEAPFEEKQMGQVQIPDKLHASLKCWGHTVDEEDLNYQAVHQHCESADEIYVSRNLYTGNFNYDVEMLSTEQLNRFQFYTLLERRFKHNRFRNAGGTEEVSAYKCHDNLMAISSGTWKISTCFRAYKKYTGLYDASMIMVTADHPDKAVLLGVSASGISQDNALATFRKVMEGITWIN